MKIIRVFLVGAVLVASGFVVSHQAPAKAADGVYTCADLNHPMFDGVYEYYAGPGLQDPWSFKAGDTIRLEADYPGVPEQRPETGRQPAAEGDLIALWMLSVIVKTGPFPGTLTYTFASDTDLPGGHIPTLGWRVDYALPNGAVAAWQVSCTPAAAAAAQVVPGCDLGMQLTPDAAVGLFVWTTDVYWAPSLDATTGITMPAGKTAWVLGMDATGEFYKFVWSCNYLWAPVGAMGPNPDDVWHSTPLPATVVE